MHSRNFVILLVMLGMHVSANAQQPPTWSADVAPIVYSKCTSCHRTGEIAPFTLRTYEDAVSHGYSIRAVTQSGFMPPWKPVQGHGDFLGDRSLTDAQRDVLARWVDAGMPAGDLATAPAMPTYPSGSQLGTPDLVLEMPDEWQVLGNSKDVYRYFVLPSGLLQDRNIAAMEFRPGNAAVVHHVLYFLDTTGTARRKDEADPLPGYGGFGDPGFESAATYLGWVPGAQQRFFPSTIGSKMYTGSDLVIQVHYAPSPIAQTDRSRVNIFFHRSPAIRVLQQFQMSPNEMPTPFVIPANNRKTFSAGFTVPLDVSLVGIAPHMHLLGVNARAYAVTPAGDTIRLVAIGDWDFNWQGSYAYRHPVKIPRNSELRYEATYDNTTNNPFNPNSPPRLATWGENTTDEMFLCYFFWLPYQPGDESISMETVLPTSVATNEALGGQPTVVPNPASGAAGIRMVLQQAGDVSVDLCSAVGAIVASQTLRDCMPGEHSIPLPLTGLANGAYFARVRLPDGTLHTLPFTVRQ